jgi:hypothetical protein
VKRGPISTGTATACAILIATVMMTVVAATLPVPGEGTAGPARALLSDDPPAETVAAYDGVPVIRIPAKESIIDWTGCRVYLTDPDGVLHNVEIAVLANTTPAGGRDVYIFRLPVDDPAASGYWITDVPEMVFTCDRHPGVHPFSPAGEWRVVVYDHTSMQNRVDRVVRINGPGSPG